MINRQFLLNLLTIFLSTIFFLALTNFFLFFSTNFINQRIIPKNILIHLPLEITYLYSDTFSKTDKVNVILGDSHAFGSGDSFLNDDYEYSIGHHLFNLFERKENFINVGYPGAGSQTIYSNYINFKKKTNIKPKKIIYLFYEGNDLENNIIYLDKYTFQKKIISTIDYYIPIKVLIENLAKFTIRKINEKINIIGNHDENISNKINFKNKVETINKSLQSPPVELSKDELNISLNVLFKTLIMLKNDTTDIIFVYLPAPTSTLNLNDPIKFQKYFNNNSLKSATSDDLFKLSEYIKFKIKYFASKENIIFLDMTEILKKKAKKLKIYGPKDYKHFNKTGYQIIANEIFISNKF